MFIYFISQYISSILLGNCVDFRKNTTNLLDWKYNVDMQLVTQSFYIYFVEIPLKINGLYLQNLSLAEKFYILNKKAGDEL